MSAIEWTEHRRSSHHTLWTALDDVPGWHLDVEQSDSSLFAYYSGSGPDELGFEGKSTSVELAKRTCQRMYEALK